MSKPRILVTITDTETGNTMFISTHRDSAPTFPKYRGMQNPQLESLAEILGNEFGCMTRGWNDTPPTIPAAFRREGHIVD